jgi:aryl-alcohol dehydrogenase-like predicted oxidoreductase
MRRALVPGMANSTTALGFGCAYLVGGFESAQNLRLVRAAYDSGIRHFDVAPLYGLGSAEDVLGRALRGNRSDVTVATKVGIARPTSSAVRSLIRVASGPLRQVIRNLRATRSTERAAEAPPITDFSPEAVSASLDESLRRLQTDYVDVLLLHEVRLADVTEALLATLQRRRQQGACRTLGLATEPEDIAAIAQAHPGVFDVFQCRWSALDWRQPLPSGARLLITHRSLLRAFDPLRRWIAADASARLRLQAATAQDVSDERILSRLLLGAALAANPNGIVLVASRRRKRIVDNASVADDEAIIAAGARLAEALARERHCPYPV